MNANKKLWVISVLGFITIKAFATNSEEYFSNFNFIHTTTVNKSRDCATTWVDTKLGNYDGKGCVYSAETNTQKVNLCGPTFDMPLIGEILAANPLAAGKTCAATVLYGDPGRFSLLGTDGPYELIWDSSKTKLLATTPSSGVINIP